MSEISNFSLVTAPPVNGVFNTAETLDESAKAIFKSQDNRVIKRSLSYGGSDDELLIQNGVGITVNFSVADIAGLPASGTYELWIYDAVNLEWVLWFNGDITVTEGTPSEDPILFADGKFGVTASEVEDVNAQIPLPDFDLIQAGADQKFYRKIDGAFDYQELPLGADKEAALTGTNGTPSAANKFVTNSDPRNTDTRTPGDLSVTAGKIATDAVETLKIKDLNVTYAKLSSRIKEFLTGNGYSSEDLQLIPHNWMPNNYAIIDKNGKVHQMVEIPRKNWDVANAFAGATIHPAFTVNAAQKRIFIGKYQASMDGAYYVTRANAEVKHSLTFDQELAAAAALNGGASTGFHLMTNAEWALVSLLSHAGATMPYGNNNYGRDADDKSISGVFEAGSTAVWGTSGTARTKCGSMGVKSSHNHQESGIFDLNGNVWERVAGLRLNAGEINILENNNAADSSKDMAAGSAEWKAILGADGSLVAPGTADTVKLAASGTDDYKLVIASGASFAGMTNPGETQVSAEALEVLEKIGVYPITSSGLGGDALYHDLTLERIPFRGGHWSDGANAGVFAMILHYARSDASDGIGFRFAFYL
jgi:formylglycine-generating enzyme